MSVSWWPEGPKTLSGALGAVARSAIVTNADPSWSRCRRTRAGRLAAAVIWLASVLATSVVAAPRSTTAAGAAGRFVPIDPVRLVDTRDGTGVPAAGRPGAGAVVRVAVAGRAGVPADAIAAVVNVTATEAAAPGFVQVFPAGADVVGRSSTLNVETAGATVPNLAVVGLGDGGALSVYTQSGTHLVVDLFGWFAPSGAVAAGRFQGLGAPQRVLDTRTAGGPLAAGGTRRLALTAAGGGPLPDGARAVVMNVTATEAAGPGYVQVVPTGGSTAFGASSNLNVDRAGQTVPNLVIVPLGADGSVTFYSQQGTQLVADVAGWFTGDGAAVSTDGLLHTVDPARLLDTRDPALTPARGPIAAGDAVRVEAAGRGGVPATDVAAVVVNATIDAATAPGYGQLFPTGRATPGSSSTLNVERAGQTRANAAVTALGGGALSFFTQSGGQLLVDVTGWFSGPEPAGAPVPTPPPPSTAVWHPALDTPWHWMIGHALDLNSPKDMGLTDPTGAALATPVPQMYDIDWQYNPASTVSALHTAGKTVVCYVDVGVYENYRPDAAAFPASVIGKPDSHWEGSFWADIRRLDVLVPIMRARFQVCRDKGFDAIEPDEIDGYANDSGFPLTYADQLTYNRAIADLAHSMGLSIGQKGDIDQVADLWPWFDWTLNEQCFEFAECQALETYYVANGKAVFQVEYDDPFSGLVADPGTFCPTANAWNFNTMKMPLNLDGGRWPCR